MTGQTTAVPICEIDVNEYGLSAEEITVLRSLEKASYKAPATSLIQKVTHILRDNEAFTKYFIPHVVTIGPIHHDDSNKYPRAELVKRPLAARFFRESGTTADLLYTNVKKKVDDLKGSYDMEWEGRDDEKVALMFLVDGCAVLQFICLDSTDRWGELGINDDFKSYLKRDFLLLENQLPYPLLDLLMMSCWPERAEALRKSIVSFINTLASVSSEEPKWRLEEQLLHGDHDHLLGMLRKRMIRSDSTFEHEMGNQMFFGGALFKFFQRSLYNFYFVGAARKHFGRTFPNIQELKQKGILFGPSDTSCLLDFSLVRKIFSFSILKDTLKLPPMRVDESTGPLYLNLIAYERCPSFRNNFEVNSYIAFLNSLIHTEEDVKELREACVLQNELLSDQEVAELFSKIGSGLAPHSGGYGEVKLRIQECCNSRFARHRAQLYHTYFSSPWSFLAFVGALLGLGLTAVQTYTGFLKK